MLDDQDPTPEAPPFDGGQPEPEPQPESGQGTGSKPGLDVQGMLGQLQSMIGKVAAASEPRLRDVAAKAAELAAVAAERAGPIAHTLADKTDEVGHSVAEKASAYASSIRTGKGDAAASAPAPDETTDAAYVSDPAEDSPRDGA